MRGTFVRRGLGAAALALAVCATGCSEEGGRQYAVPGTVCGVPVGKSAFTPLLPDGEKLKEHNGASATSDEGCTVMVDGYRAVSFGWAGREKFVDPMRQRESADFEHRKRMRELSVRGTGAVGDDNAMVSTACGTPDARHLTFDFRFGNDREESRSAEDVRERREAITRFVNDVVPRAKKRLGCRA